MVSSALSDWTTGRAARLDQLVEAHGLVRGTGPGQQTRTEQINWSLVLRLAGEFQGFCRDLHQLGSEVFADWSSGTNQALRNAILGLLTRDRLLNRGNATGKSLESDFGRFGIRWWDALEARDGRISGWRGHLDRLNRARNAIAHSDLGAITALEKEGSRLKLATFTSWRRSLDGLARTMDAELAVKLSILFGREVPW